MSILELSAIPSSQRSKVRLVYFNFHEILILCIAEADAALDELLNLMELSLIWEVTELSHQAVDAILKLRLIRFDNCEDSEWPERDERTTFIAHPVPCSPRASSSLPDGSPHRRL